MQSQEDQAEHGSFLALRSSTGLSRNLSNANDALPALCSPRISSLLLQANIVSMPSWPRGMSPSRCLGIRCQGLAGAFQFSFLGHAEFNDQYFGTRNGRVLDCVMWKKISKSAKEILRQRRTQTPVSTIESACLQNKCRMQRAFKKLCEISMSRMHLYEFI